MCTRSNYKITMWGKLKLVTTSLMILATTVALLPLLFPAGDSGPQEQALKKVLATFLSNIDTINCLF